MPFKKGEPREPGPGRPKGTPNKTSKTAKENIMAVFEGMGGTITMQAWANANRSDFYKIYGRLIPTDVKIDPEANKIEVIVRQFYKPLE